MSRGSRLRIPLYLDYDLVMHYRMYEAMMSFPSIPTPRVLGYEGDPASSVRRSS